MEKSAKPSKLLPPSTSSLPCCKGSGNLRLNYLQTTPPLAIKRKMKLCLELSKTLKLFFSFARSRQKTKARVGPFLDESGKPNPSPDFSAEALRQQYNSVFAIPRPAWNVTNFPEHFKAGNSDDDSADTLLDTNFGPEDIEKACAELKDTAAAGLMVYQLCC